MSLALKQQQQELQTKRKQFDEDKRLFDEEHQRYMKELEDSMRSDTCVCASQLVFMERLSSLFGS